MLMQTQVEDCSLLTRCKNMLLRNSTRGVYLADIRLGSKVAVPSKLHSPNIVAEESKHIRIDWQYIAAQTKLSMIGC
jgi:hypothetical protein